MSRKKYITSFFLGLCLISSSLFAGELSAPETNVDLPEGIVDLGLTGKQLGQVKNTYLIPLNLEQAPIQADIEMSFVVITTGACPTSYFPTEVFFNSERIASIDFRELDEGSKQSMKINLPMRYQQQGKNMIKIITGDCNEGLDSMRFNNVSLHIEKSS